jgi:Cu+-exporting ATPase
MANATIEYDDTILSIKQIEGNIQQSGYKSTGIFKLADEKNQSGKQKIWLILFGALTLLVLYLAMGPMIGIPVPNFVNMHHNAITYGSVLFALTILFLAYGSDIFVTGTKALLHKAPNMDTLVSLGVLASFGYSVFALIMVICGHHAYVDSLYFESCTVIIYFIKLGRYIDHASKNKTKQAIKDLVQITPPNAIIKENGQEKEVTIDEIKVGDIVVCHAGEKIAVDGVITVGSAHLDESFITGESKPASKQVGDTVIAGSINYDGYIEYTAQKIGKNSTISEIVRLVVDATNTKMPIAKIADKVSGIFVPTIMGIAFVAFIAYLCAGQGINVALTTFVTVLVVACPCALGLATPLAIVVSEGKCANSGILVKKSETLELANKTNVVVFDKTGTLTYGKLKVSQMHNFSTMDDNQIYQIAYSLESLSTHPISTAFISLAKEQNLPALPVENFTNIDGLGIYGEIDGKKVVMGNNKILAHYCIENLHQNDEQALAENGNSIVYLAIDNAVIALFGVNDLIRDNAKDVIWALKKRNIQTIMLTGDNQATANIVASSLKIDKVIANVLPTQKAEIIRQLKSEGKVVMMCGDGINDSPALASADIGISVHNGTDIAMNSSDVILLSDDLSKILDLLLISKKTIVNIKENLFWAFFYNCLMLPIALGALKPIGISISPMIAGGAMVLSSLTVIFNALRLKLIKTNKKENK